MAMTDEEILREAGRVRASRRRRVRKTCAVCGTPFEGIAQRRYCSDACRVRASRRRAGEQPVDAERVAASNGVIGTERQRPPAARGKHESIDDYLTRVQAYIMGAPGAPDRQRSGERVGAPYPIAAELPQGEDESYAEYFARVGRAMMRGVHPRELEDWEDSALLIRQMREERTAELLRASGLVEEDGEPPAPRGEGEPLLDYLDRVTSYVMGDQVFEDDSATLTRQGRQERTAEVLQAIESPRAKR